MGSGIAVNRTGGFGREALAGFTADVFAADTSRYGYRRTDRGPRGTGIVVGWSMSHRTPTDLAGDAIEQAAGIPAGAGVLFIIVLVGA